MPTSGKSSTEMKMKKLLEGLGDGEEGKRSADAAAEVKRRFFILGKHLDWEM